tara:strand:+ start:36230 stop:37996 length:1767 start_codon:yes stop_codon:yes gene_type:complete
MNERQRSSAGLHDDLLGGLLGGLRSELDQDVQALRDLRSVQSRAGRIDVLSADLDQQLERVERAAVLTLVGATGAGKSTLLNALVGRDVAHEGDSRPTTRVPVIHRPADADIRELLDGLPGEAPKVVDHDPGGGGPWSQQILVDAPDTNSVEASHREVVAALAERSDVLVVVAHRQSVAELSSATFVDDFAKRRALVFVLGRADELSDADRGALLEQLRTLVRERWNAPDAPILAVSPRDAQRNPSSPGWQELVSTLRGLAEDGALGRVRRHNALGTAAELSRVFADVDHEIGVTLDELVTFIASGVESWRAGLLQEVAVRLDLKRPDVTALVQSEAAKRWEGPGGWALRTGGLTTMGLSAGALLARRNPLLAAGAAAGAMAADRARGAIRNAGIADPTGLLPSHAGMTALYHQSFGPARMVASDLANDGAESLAVPLEDVLAQMATDTVEDVWATLVTRDLPEQAEKVVSRFLRWAVDAPVLALGVWVVVAAGRGLWTGQHAGLDLLLSTAVVGMAWLFLTRMVVRSLLGRRARRVLARARVQLEGRLAGETAQLGQAAGQALDARRAAVERLTGLGERWRRRALGS